MAWINKIAGKAEDLLNKIDQNAANVLNDSQQLEEEVMSEVKKELRSTPNVSPINSEEDNSEMEYFLSEVLPSENPDLSARETKTINEADVNSSKSSSLHGSFVLYEDSPDNDRLSRLQAENGELKIELDNMKQIYYKMRDKIYRTEREYEHSVLVAKNTVEELELYRNRVQKILQEKENLIHIKSDDSPQTMQSNLQSYCEELKKQLNQQIEQNSVIENNILALKDELRNTQNETNELQLIQHRTEEKFQEQLAEHNRIIKVLENECRDCESKLRKKSDDLAAKNGIIESKNREIHQLQNLLKHQNTENINETYENRIKSLSDTLLSKQRTLNAITTERNELKIKIEKIETAYENNLKQLQGSQMRVIQISENEEEKPQIPQFMRPSLMDAGVTRRMKGAYSTLDSISIQTGIFLRRYPLPRVFVFCYIIMLQLLVLLLLFIYEPSNK